MSAVLLHPGCVAVDAPAPGAFGLLPGVLELETGGTARSLVVLTWGDRILARLPEGEALVPPAILRVVPAAPLRPLELQLAL